MERLLNVTGTGIVEAIPDKTEVVVSVKSIRDTYYDSEQYLFNTVKNIHTVLSKYIDVKNIYSSRLNIRKVEYRDKNNQFISRYEGLQCLRVVFVNDDSLLTNIMHSVIDLKNNDITVSINFVVSDIKPYKETAMTEAVKDAQIKANILAEASDVVLDNLVNINYAWDTINVTARKSASLDFGASFSDVANVQLNPESQRVQETVTMTWAIR